MARKGKKHQRKNGLMFGRFNQQGFTLIEILVAIVLIGIMATIVVPSLTRGTGRYGREQFIYQLQALVQLGWQSALSTGKIHRVLVDIDKRAISLGSASGTFDKNGDPEFKPAKVLFVKSSMTWPAHIQIKQFNIEGFDEMSRYGVGRKTTEMWFYIMPDGLTQEVTINALDTKDLKNNKPRPFSLVLSPFSAIFKYYDTFQA